LNRQILKLAIPNILSNLSIPLLSSVDIALMGRQEGAEYIGAVALGALIFNFVYWSFAFLRMGTTGFAAQAYGQSDKHQIINVLARALLLAVISGVIILMIQIPLGEMSFRLLGASEAVETISKEYYYTRVWAAPATLSLYVLMGWFFGMQNSIFPLILTLVVNSMNIICNVYFVSYLGMQADGVALGSVIAQYTGLVVGILLFLYKYREYLPFL
jgi:MATE family multidrug resistance protein